MPVRLMKYLMQLATEKVHLLFECYKAISVLSVFRLFSASIPCLKNWIIFYLLILIQQLGCLTWSEITCFIHKKAQLFQYKDWRLVGCSRGGIWWTCEQLNEFLDQATRISCCHCQSERWEIGVWTGLLIKLIYELIMLSWVSF